MSRELKFRAWDIKNKRFVNIVRLILDQFGALDYADVVYMGKIYKLYPSEVVLEQATGLKDKNGKDICEGDIVNTCCGKARVYFDEEYCSYKIQLKHGTTMPLVGKKSHRHLMYEVIGNINENPELLGGRK